MSVVVSLVVNVTSMERCYFSRLLIVATKIQNNVSLKLNTLEGDLPRGSQSGVYQFYCGHLHTVRMAAGRNASTELQNAFPAPIGPHNHTHPDWSAEEHPTSDWSK